MYAEWNNKAAGADSAELTMPKLPTPIVDIRRSGDRTETRLSWLRGRHSFWIGGRPYDPDNTHRGLPMVHNEDVIKPIYPGLAQRMTAGAGIMHSEKNDSWRLGGEQHTDPVRLVQMWGLGDEAPAGFLAVPRQNPPPQALNPEHP